MGAPIIKEMIKDQNIILEKPLTGMELKNIDRAQKIIEGIRARKTYTQIAEELRLSRPQLYSVMSQDEVQQLMYKEFIELDTEHKKIIDKMFESPSPQDKRVALTINEKRIKRLQDKIQPSLFLHQNINLNIDSQRFRENQQILEETLRRLPIDQFKNFMRVFNEVKRGIKQGRIMDGS